MAGEVQDWLERQEPEARAGIERLRETVTAVPATWAESIKWNAPSFAVGGQDRVTLGLDRNGGWRLVLHRGAARASGVAFRDAAGLARWPSPDRGVVQFRTLDDIARARPDLVRLISDWIAAG